MMSSISGLARSAQNTLRSVTPQRSHQPDPSTPLDSFCHLIENWQQGELLKSHLADQQVLQIAMAIVNYISECKIVLNGTTFLVSDSTESKGWLSIQRPDKREELLVPRMTYSALRKFASNSVIEGNNILKEKNRPDGGNPPTLISLVDQVEKWRSDGPSENNFSKEQMLQIVVPIVNHSNMCKVVLSDTALLVSDSTDYPDCLLVQNPATRDQFIIMDMTFSTLRECALNSYIQLQHAMGDRYIDLQSLNLQGINVDKIDFSNTLLSREDVIGLQREGSKCVWTEVEKSTKYYI